MQQYTLSYTQLSGLHCKCIFQARIWAVCWPRPRSECHPASRCTWIP